MTTMESGYFRRLTVFETFSRLVSIYVDSAHARLFIKLACLMVVPCTFLGMIIIKYVTTNLFETHDTSDYSAYLVQNWFAILLIMGSKLFFKSCGAILSDAAIVYTVAELYVGSTRPSWTTGLQVALRNVHHLFLAGLMIFVAFSLGYTCGALVGGIFIGVVTSLVTPAIVIENKTALQGLERSVQLTQGFRWYILACLIMLSILKFAVSYLLNMIFSGSDSAYSMWFSVWGYFINMLPASIFVPAAAILKAIIYLSIRGEKENLDADHLVQEMGHASLLSPSQIFQYQQVAVADETAEGGGGVAMGDSSSLETGPAI